MCVFQVLKKELSTEELDAFMREAAIMAQMRHPNVVSLVGVCTAGMPKMLVMQHCEHGSLLSFMQAHFGFNELLLRSKLKIMEDVACGMSFLSSLLIVHRDLAARNILIGADYVCKVFYGLLFLHINLLWVDFCTADCGLWDGARGVQLG